MPNIAVVLKEEIVRLARKELRAETDTLRKASTQYRSEIAALKKRLTTLEQQIARLQKKSAKAADVAVEDETPSRVRFTAKGFRTLRQRLGLSAADLGTLLGVSGQTIYNWEAETTRPRGPQIAAIAAWRKLGKREATARLRLLAGNDEAVEDAATEA